MKTQKLFVAHYQTEQQVQDAVRELMRKGYDTGNLYIIGKDCYTEQNLPAYHNIYQRIEKWAMSNLLPAAGLLGLSSALFLFFKPKIGKPCLKTAISPASESILSVMLLPLISLGFKKKIQSNIKPRSKRTNICYLPRNLPCRLRQCGCCWTPMFQKKIQ